ncbi:hypothetical protein Cgig2_029259 [Carnegiea gigantea]|uniref:Uncharacterized protein n=1 Tax=Carnegiea gigantea TaxID=171969 RepID=A0A9Q1KWJ4_9CARY|nr:hypothetical protein Cgig2_029259 [Carnegiea gigantea]
MNNRVELGRPASGKRRLKDLLLQKDNRVCADCGAPDPKWASANIGVFICLKCCGVHRSLGPHISKVLSVTLDNWSDENIDNMIEVGGNAAVNAIYEAYITEGCPKPGPNASHDHRMKFIRSKYELQEFMKPSLRTPSISSTNNNPLQPNLSKKLMNSFRKNSAKKSETSENTSEFIGTLKVKVVKGTNLAVRDMLSSDPYVILNLGKQTVQTTVVRSNLNPIWNEVLTLSVPEEYGMFSDMQIGKWLKSNDNALIEDSVVNIVDGKVKQGMQLKLQNVESGDLELELEWEPIEQ